MEGRRSGCSLGTLLRPQWTLPALKTSGPTAAPSTSPWICHGTTW
uniref:Alternative protein TLR9 n=1 Tax=Homo sapiens TaxID=9606 RepID=L8E8B9_HUMAN|nr:alternative protein TLR9 [Homo sapiens]